MSPGLSRSAYQYDLENARSLLQRLRRGPADDESNGSEIVQTSGPCARFLVWRVLENWDGQGLSDRRACLAVILAEALLLNRVAALPTFTLSGQHNNGTSRSSDLMEYLSLRHIPVQTVPLKSLPSRVWKDAMDVHGELNPIQWKDVSASALIRYSSREGFWKSGIHASVMKLAGLFHGTGMQPTAGLFDPSTRVVEAAAQVRLRLGLGAYVGVHVRRGDKLLIPGLDLATTPEAVAERVAHLAPPGVRMVYVATNDTQADYGTALLKRGFQCFSSHCWLPSVSDNFFLFAVEMQIVDAASVSIRTFNDSMPWYRAGLAKPSHCLLDRSMHDYVFGFSATGSLCTWPVCGPVPLDLGTLWQTAAAEEAEETPSEPAGAEPVTKYSILVLEGPGQSSEGSKCWEFPANLWPMETSGKTQEVTLELLEPWLRSAPKREISTWTEYFGALAAFADDISEGLVRRSTLYAFENVSKRHRHLTSATIPRRGAVFCYVSVGKVSVRDQHGAFEIVAGQYCVVPAPVRFELINKTRLVAVHTHPFQPLRTIGGPIESKGRLRYVDGCSDTLLLAPPKLSDPCLNLLHFPPGIHQTLHTHPSVRCGLIASGAGYCMDGDHRKMELEEGMVWAIPKDAVHSFHTAESNEELNVIAFHPDSDWGPLDEDHPMLNRTWVDGAKIDNCTESHRRADMLLTDQSRALHLASSLKKALSQRELQPPESPEPGEADGGCRETWVVHLALLADGLRPVELTEELVAPDTPSTQYCRAALTSEQTARQGLQQLSLRIGDTRAADGSCLQACRVRLDTSSGLLSVSTCTG
ncbi:CPK8 [Symbiodinium sp. CCMP2592]|nr:CPK8 [Symbiodinium sp. CCMP2592]